MSNIIYKVLEQFNNDLYNLNAEQLKIISEKLGCICHDLLFLR